ncbi:MAG: type II secretion system secretin GspD [Myxococcota bacterium]
MRLILIAGMLTAAAAFAEPRESCLELRKTARFTVYFEKVELEKLVQTVSDATCRAFIVGENVKGKISLIGPENGKLMLDADQFYAAFLAALDANGLATVQQGRFTRIVDKPRARQYPGPLLSEGDAGAAANELVTRVHRLAHVDVEAVRPVVTPFLTQGGELVAAPPDLLLITDLSANQARLASLLALLDVERAPTELTRLVQVRHAAAEELLDKVTRALTPKSAKPQAEQLTALADERTNRLLLVGGRALVERAEALVQQLDVPVPADSRARVVRLANADAKELAATLEAMTGGGARKTPLPPGGAPSGTTTGEVRISVNEALNALLIVSSAGDFRVLSEVIAELDQPVRQVFIETLIMEVSLQRDSKFGVSMHGGAGSTDTPIVFGSQPQGAPSSLALQTLASSSGLLAGVRGPVLAGLSSLLGIDLTQFGFAIQASQGTSDVNVLSTPHLLTADNKEAEINVGQRVPFQMGVNQAQVAAAIASGNANSATLAQLTGSVSREKVELKLTVKPHIGAGDDIRLEVNQQAEEISGSNTLGPITSTRGQKTSIVAKSEETVVLGGIMQDRELETVSKIPLLGDVPLLGQLFRSTTKTKTKVNLLVFLTPHIIHDTADLRRLMERKLRERERLVEQFFGGRNDLERTLDFERKPGPLAALERARAREARRPEHGGRGEPTDRVLEPMN